MGIDRKIARKLRKIEEKVRNSFGFIRQDIGEFGKVVDGFRIWIKLRKGFLN